MIIFLYGIDSYRRGKKLRELVDRYHSKHSSLDFRDIDLVKNPILWKEVRDFVGQPSLFVPVKLAVIRESGSVREGVGVSRSDMKGWIDFLRRCVEDKNTFLIISDSVAPRKAFSFLLNKPIIHQEFPLLESVKLKLFIERELSFRSCALSSDALRFFIQYLGQFKEERAWIIVNLLEQISLASFSQPISLDDFRKIVSWEAYDENFRLANRLLDTQSLGTRLVALESLFLCGDASRYILNLISSCARDRNSIIALSHIDEEVKSGVLDDETILTKFVFG
jgi:hypothetical protein